LIHVPPGEALTYAGGLHVGSRNKRETIHHYGGWLGYRSAFLLYPAENLALICLSCEGEAVRPGKLVEQVADAIFGEDAVGFAGGQQPAPSTLKATAPLRAGTFCCRELDVAFEVHERESKLFLRRPFDQADIELTPAAQGCFEFTPAELGAPITMTLAPSETGFIVDLMCSNRVLFTRQ